MEYFVSFSNACGYGKWYMRGLLGGFLKDTACVLFGK